MTTRVLYRALLKSAREFDSNPGLKQELIRCPLPIIQAAATGLDRRKLNVRILFDDHENGGAPRGLAGTEHSLPRRDITLASTADGTEAVEGGPAEGDIVAALHPSYGRSLMNGSDTYWDATVAARLPDGSLCLHFRDGDKCTWDADKKGLETEGHGVVAHVKQPLPSWLASSSSSPPPPPLSPPPPPPSSGDGQNRPHSSSSSQRLPVLAVGGFYGDLSHPRWYRASALMDDDESDDGDSRGGGNEQQLGQQQRRQRQGGKGKEFEGAWSLVEYCRKAFRSRRENAFAGGIKNAFQAEPGATEDEAIDQSAVSAREDEAFSVLAAVAAVRAEHRARGGGGSFPVFAAAAAGGKGQSSPFLKSTRPEEEVARVEGEAAALTANGLFFTAVEASDGELMKLAWKKKQQESSSEEAKGAVLKGGEGEGKALKEQGDEEEKKEEKEVLLCIRPGQPILRGWNEIRGYWAKSFEPQVSPSVTMLGAGAVAVAASSGGASGGGEKKVLLDDVIVQLGTPHSFTSPDTAASSLPSIDAESGGGGEEEAQSSSSSSPCAYASLTATVTQTVTIWQRVGPSQVPSGGDGGGGQDEGRAYKMAVTNTLKRDGPGQPFLVVLHHASLVVESSAA